MSKKEIFLLCIDGGDLDLFSPLMKMEKMPYLKKIQEEGAHGYLTSIMPPITAPAWSSFITGKNPGKHGIYGFALKKKESYEHTILNSALREGKAFWDILGEKDKKAVVLNLPTTYPPTPINGAMISGFLTPSGKRDFSYPKALFEELEDKFGPYPLYFKTPIAITNDKNIDDFLKECFYALEYKFKTAFYLKEKYKSDITILHIWETDQIFHWLLHLLDERHPAFDKKKKDKFIDKINDYFSQLDQNIGTILNGLGENGALIIASDHGFNSCHLSFDLNTWLYRQGYLSFKKSLSTRLRLLLWRLGVTPEFLINKIFMKALKAGIKLRSRSPLELIELLNRRNLLFLSLYDIDWSRTRAFSRFGFGQIFFNVRGREPAGIVNPGEEYNLLKKEIMEKLNKVINPETGLPFKDAVMCQEDISKGPYSDDAPDIIFSPLEEHCLPTDNFMTKSLFTTSSLLSGIHRRKGIFFAIGSPFTGRIELQKTSIMDIAPTILYTLGCKIPEDMDGKVLKEIFLPQFLADNLLKFSAPEKRDGGKSRHSLSQEEEEDLKSRLKALGYLS